MSNKKVTVFILTKNESLHIKRCLDSLRNIADKIVIIDSFSTDDTKEICLSYGDLVEFSEHPWKNYADQFQWGLDNHTVNTEWCMRMDADEYIDSELQNELLSKLPELTDDINCIFIRRKYIYKNKWIRHGGVYPLNLLRVWRTGTGRIEQRWMDEHIVVQNPRTTQFHGHIYDQNLNDIRLWSDKHLNYADREVVDLLNIKYSLFKKDDEVKKNGGFQEKIKRLLKEKIYFKLPPSIRSLLYFLYRYLWMVLRDGTIISYKGFGIEVMSILDLKN